MSASQFLSICTHLRLCDFPSALGIAPRPRGEPVPSVPPVEKATGPLSAMGALGAIPNASLKSHIWRCFLQRLTREIVKRYISWVIFETPIESKNFSLKKIH